MIKKFKISSIIVSFKNRNDFSLHKEKLRDVLITILKYKNSFCQGDFN